MRAISYMGFTSEEHERISEEEQQRQRQRHDRRVAEAVDIIERQVRVLRALAKEMEKGGTSEGERDAR